MACSNCSIIKFSWPVPRLPGVFPVTATAATVGPATARDCLTAEDRASAFAIGAGESWLAPGPWFAAAFGNVFLAPALG